MKAWGLNRWGALVVVLLLLAVGAVLPQGVHAQGKKVFGQVTDCATNNPVAATVTLSNAHAQTPDDPRTTSPSTGFFLFEPKPGYYRIKVAPSGFTHFPTETAPFRFDGTTNIQKDVCVNAIPAKPYRLKVVVLDGQLARVSNETVTFSTFARGPENATNPAEPGGIHFAPGSGLVSLQTSPLVWFSEKLSWVNATTILGGETLVRGVHYDYTTQEAFDGKVRITHPTIRSQLNDTLFNGPNKGWLTVTYRNATKHGALRNANTLNEAFFRNGTALAPFGNFLNLDRDNGTVEITSGTWAFGRDVLNATYDWARPVASASVTMLAPNGEPIAAAANTGADGRASFGVYAATFDVKVQADTYSPSLTSRTISGDDSLRVFLFKGRVVRVVALGEQDGDFGPILASDGLTGVLINRDGAAREIQVIRGLAQDNLLVFHAYAGNWTLVVDADGFAANATSLVIGGTNVTKTVILEPTVQERFETRILFRGQDWGNLTIYRNMTLPADGAFPGVDSGYVRNVTWQLDLEHGIGTPNGVWSAAENTAFQANVLLPSGPFYTTTTDFFTVNGKTYRSVPATYTATSTLNPNGSLSVVTRSDYTLSDATKPIPENRHIYYVNLTALVDQNATVYQNHTYFVHLPRTYEMTSRSVSGDIRTRNFTTVEVDPGEDASVPNPRANLVVEKSLTGVARAEVEGPAGKVFVKEADQKKYLAWVANSTKIVFSANKTTDRENDAINAKDASFLWRFKNNTDPGITGTGIWTTYDYGNVSGEFVVNLTVTQVGGNQTWRAIKVFVDNRAPNANFKTNRTGTGLNPANLTVKEDLNTLFDGRDSSDTLDGTTAGEIGTYRWDFDGDGNEDHAGSTRTWNYTEPGSYWFNFSVVDRVGHRSANRTMRVDVSDTTPPTINFFILEESTWRETVALRENDDYWFNANATTDNSLEDTRDNVNLTYKWEFGDGTTVGPGLGHDPATNESFLNVTHRYTKFSSGYKLKLSVTDASGNNFTLERTVVVQANTSLHPDIRTLANTLKVSPTSPEEGQTVTFTFNITNEPARANATALRAQLKLVTDGQETEVTEGVTYRIGGVAPEQARLDSGSNTTVEVTWTAPSPPANYSVKIVVWDENEPESWVTGLNSVSSSVLVREAGYRIWLIVGVIAFIVFGIPIILYVVRKVRAGELSLPKRRPRKEADEDEEDEDEPEEDEGADEEPAKKRL